MLFLIFLKGSAGFITKFKLEEIEGHLKETFTKFRLGKATRVEKKMRVAAVVVNFIKNYFRKIVYSKIK